METGRKVMTLAEVMPGSFQNFDDNRHQTARNLTTSSLRVKSVFFLSLTHVMNLHDECALNRLVQ